MTFAVDAIGTAATGTGNLTPSIPAGTMTGKLMLLCASSGGSADTISLSAGWTLIKQGSVSGFAVYGRIGTASESAPTVTISGTNAHAAFIVAISSTDGWPAIGDVLVDSSSGNNSSLSVMRYGSLTVTEENLCGIQFGSKNMSTAGTNACTDVTVTSGYTDAGFAARNVTTTGIVISAQLYNGSPTVASGMAQNEETTTGNTDSGSQRRISLTLRADQSGGFTYDASSREESPYNGLWLGLLDSIGAFATGDTYEQNGTPTPATAEFELFALGVLSITFDSPDPSPITIPFKFMDNSTGDVHLYSLTFYPPDDEGPDLSNVSVVSIDDDELTVQCTVTDDRPPISVYVVVLPEGDLPPSATQIMLGNDASDNAAPNGSGSTEDSGGVLVNVPGLLAETDYDVHVVAADSLGNKSSITIIQARTTGVAYPASSVAPRKTRVKVVNSAVADVMDDGTVRAAYFYPTPTYRVTIQHTLNDATHRAALDTFFALPSAGGHFGEDVDVTDGYGDTYRCLLVNRIEWDDVSPTHWNGTLELLGRKL